MGLGVDFVSPLSQQEQEQQEQQQEQEPQPKSKLEFDTEDQVLFSLNLGIMRLFCLVLMNYIY